MGGYDGMVIIGTTLSTKELEKQLKEEEKNLTRYEKENEVLINARVKLEKGKAMQEYQKLKEAIEKTYSTKIDMTVGEEEESLRQKYLARQNEELQKLNEAYSEQFKKLEDINNQLAENEMHQELIKGKIEDINVDLNKSKGYDKVKSHLSDIGKGTESVIKKVAKWGLAIFSIRSAYMLIRQSISTLSEHNKKLSADIQNIRYALASALEPIIKWIVDLVYKLLGYVQYFIYKLTGRNIFENVNKGLKNANKQAKELQKTLAGFDEMNILGQNTKAEGTGGTTSPSVDLSQMPSDIPWIDKFTDLIKNKDIQSGIMGLLGFFKTVGPLVSKFGLKLGALKALGIGVALKGVVKSIGSIKDYLKEDTWENFGGILEGLGETVLGIGIYTGNVPLILGGVILTCLGLIARFWEEIKGFFTNIMDGVTTLSTDIKKWLSDNLGIFGDMIGIAIDFFVSGFKEGIKFVIEFFEGLFTSVKNIIDGIIKIFNGQLGEGLKSIFRGIGNAIINVLNKVIDALNIIFTPLRAIIMVAGNILGNDWTMDDIRIPNVPRLARGGIVHNAGDGVLMGNYIAGEGMSPEAVIPLDDNTLDRLGESIAKHMTINANIYNTMNGRVISRELQKIQNESNFAYNS